MNSQELIKSTAEFRIENPDQYTSQLVIEEIFPEDEGEYTCVFQNKFGMDQTSTELTVYGEREGTHFIPFLRKFTSEYVLFGFKCCFIKKKSE